MHACPGALSIFVSVIFLVRQDMVQLYKLSARSVSSEDSVSVPPTSTYPKSGTLIDLQMQFREQKLSVEAQRLQEQAEKQRLAQEQFLQQQEQIKILQQRAEVERIRQDVRHY